jgi:DNA-directed RNA polymerase specialized sigma24 family protein
MEGNTTEATQPARQTAVGSEQSAASEEIYLAHAALLRKIAIRKFGIPRAEAETLVHDVFATYLMHSASVRDLTPYLIGAICNASRQYLRRSHVENVLFCEEVPCAATPGDALTDEIHRKLTLSRVLPRIGKRCRELFHRYYIEGEASRSIADAFNTTPATILVFLHGCRKRARAACQLSREKN